MSGLLDLPDPIRPEGLSARGCLDQALALEATEPTLALDWVKGLVDGGDDFAAWTGAAGLLDRLGRVARKAARRVIRLGIVGSYTTNQLVDLIRVAAFRYGVFVETYEAGYGQYRQEVLDSHSGLYRFRPDVVLFAVHDGAVEIPDRPEDPDGEVDDEVDRWHSLWGRVRETSGAAVIHHNFVVAPDHVFGHLTSSMAGTRASVIEAVNLRLSRSRPPGVAIVDCDAVAAGIGKDVWFDPRYWYLAKQAVSLGAMPALARHTAAVLAAQLGLSRKVLVVDLDGILWGGIIGEDGLGGITLGQVSAAGQAHVDFQHFCKHLAERGVILAVCSQNDERAALLPFRGHPDMVLHEDDIAVFAADWRPKPDKIRRIAASLGVGLDAIVFVDDDPVQRESVRLALPEVEVPVIPEDPAELVPAVAGTLLFEVATFTVEDRSRTAQYRARRKTRELKESARSLDEFHRSMATRAEIGPIDEVHLARAAQLIGKTNQFNLTGRRYSEAALRKLIEDPSVVAFYVKLHDRLVDHGLISVVVARLDGDLLDIDVWVMSCRVVGRTVERTVLSHLVDEARRCGATAIGGTFVPSGKNDLVASLYDELGFSPDDGSTESQHWVLPIPAETPQNDYIEVTSWQ